MKVKLENLSKRWGKVVGADHINLEINDGEFVAFLGPSGCGKTTTLLMVAGIYKPTEGTIHFDDKVVNFVAPKDRNIGIFGNTDGCCSCHGRRGYNYSIRVQSSGKRSEEVF